MPRSGRESERRASNTAAHLLLSFRFLELAGHELAGSFTRSCGRVLHYDNV